MTFISFVVVGLLAVFGVSSLVEFYKKTIRKGNAKKWENWLVGGVLSVGMAALICLTGIAYPVFSNVYVNLGAYAVVIFLVQFFLDMKVIKKVLASALENTDVTKLIGVILPKLGLTPEKVKDFLKSLGITRETLVLKLIEAGLSKDKAEEVAQAIFGDPEEVKATENPS